MYKSPARRTRSSEGKQLRIDLTSMVSPHLRPKMPGSDDSKLVRTGIMVAAGMIAAWWVVGSMTGSSSIVTRSASSSDLQIASWNIAAINNNPFEYWITHDDEAYNKMMLDVQDFIETPGDKDVSVSDVFTEKMFQELKAEMGLAGWEGLEETEAQWNDNYKNRKIISGFMKDGSLGDKRLASMPDRTTNTILTPTGPVYRPTVINCYEGRLDTIADWWDQWKNFIFKTKVMKKSSSGEVVPTDVRKLLAPIKKSKYPAVTEEEEKISIPLQTMCGAIFDSILVYIATQVAPAKWQSLRSEMCAALNLKKTEHTLGIMKSTYNDVDVFFVQEVAQDFISTARKDPELSQFDIVSPKVGSKANQNSVIFVRKSVFDFATHEDVSERVYLEFGDKKVPVSTGDILAVTIKDKSGHPYMLASFHGDTNGLATIPVVTAINSVLNSLSEKHSLVFGLDANTYEHAKPGKTQDVLEFAQSYVDLGLTSVWGNHPDPTNHTTYNARTFLQPQLNKAARRDELVAKGDVNPKDFILFRKDDFVVERLWKDNTGVKSYVENMVFPTLRFPSDHGVLSAALRKQF